MDETPLIFNRALKQRQRTQRVGEHFLLHASNEHLQEVLAEDIIQPFASGTMLEPNPALAAALTPRIGQLHAPTEDSITPDDRLHVAENTDIIISSLQLHWVNDLPGVLAQANARLNDKGLFLATMLGGHTLHELRHCITLAESELRGGSAPRVSPMVDVKDAGRLLQRTGYHLPVASSHILHARYSDVFSLMRELKHMGEQNALAQRQPGLVTTSFFERVNALYQAHYSTDNKLDVTFEILTLTGWKN